MDGRLRAGHDGLGAMANRNLTNDELVHVNQLLAEVRKRLVELSGDDPLLLFAYRRKIAKELGYDERGKPSHRNKLKLLKWGLQDRKCAHCGEEMAVKYSELDRRNAADGYTEENTELVHAKCHHERQAAKGYS
jgi:UTP:GlnB (protein PII) uridylyltransferase